MSPKNNSTTADRFPCSRLSRPQSTISQSDFHPVIRPFSPLRLGRSYRLAPEPDGSPLFTLLPLVACWRYRTPGAPQTARVVAACDSAFPFERQGRLLRSRSISGLYSRSLHSGLQPPCLRFATAVTGRHARLDSRLLARLCRGRHCRRQNSTRLQGATLIEPDSTVRPPSREADTGSRQENALKHKTRRDGNREQGDARRSPGWTEGYRSGLRQQSRRWLKRPAGREPMPGARIQRSRGRN